MKSLCSRSFNHKCFVNCISVAIIFLTTSYTSASFSIESDLQVSAQIKYFDIPAGPAEQTLIDFAKQSDLTIVFPYTKVTTKTTNAIVGSLQIEQAVNNMLDGTGLVASFETDGILTIKRVSIQDSEYANRSIIDKVVDLFTEEGKDTIVFSNEMDEIEEIEIQGLRESLNWGLELKQSAIDVSDSIQAEEIGKFPDTNLAESLQRISGVAIDRAEGEGQFVTVRGFGPQFNTVQSNGRSLATDNRGREFSFDTISPELVRAITVHKTFSASRPSGGIGSTINIETARPFASKEFEFGGSLKATIDTNRNNVTPHGTIYARNSNDKLGWLVSLSHQVRKTLDYLRSNFDIKTDSTSLGHWFTSSNLENVQTDGNGTALSFSQAAKYSLKSVAFSRRAPISAILWAR